MTDTTFFRDRLSQDETLLANLKVQRQNLDSHIEALEQMVLIERSVVYREEPDAAIPLMPGTLRYGSKKSRIHNAIKQMLTERGTMHRKEIHEQLCLMALAERGEKGLAYMCAAYLSPARGVFVSDHNGNWSLAQPKEQQ